MEIKPFLIQFVCLAVFLLLLSQTTIAKNEKFDQILKQEFDGMIMLNNQLASCTRFYTNNMAVLGISNGQCHFYSGFIEINGQKKPVQECYVPLPVLQKEMQRRNAILSKYELKYDFGRDQNLIEPYCKLLNNTNNTNND